MRRAPAALAVGAGLAFAGWSLGSGALALAGIGLTLTGVWGWAWAALATRAVTVERAVGRTTLVEGDDLVVDVRLRGARFLPGTFRLQELLGPAGTVEVELSRRDAVPVRLRAAPRGRYPIGPGRLHGTEPLGFGWVERAVAPAETVVTVPRVPVVDRLFLDGGRLGAQGRRPLAGRSGSDPVGVRAYEDGEPLRAVHWPSSARRGRLMVRELHDVRDDESVVLLDLDARGVVGPPGSSSLDEAIRAAAAVVRASVVGGRQAALILAGRDAERLSIASLGRDWDDVLVALAAVEPVETSCAAALLRQGGRILGSAALTVVTTRGAEPFAETLLARGGALVVVDSPTYAGARPSAPEPALLRVAGHGVPVAVVRCGDDVARALSAVPGAVAHG